MNYFSDDELRCKCGCGELEFDEKFRRTLNSIRHDCGFPLPVTSGYRCPEHPIESAKDKPGAHSFGAVDIAVYGERAYTLVAVAMKHGVERIGINQRGDYGKRFIHLDNVRGLPSPTIWTY
jgi:hypothetical protein